MEPYEIAAFLSATEIVNEQARTGQTITIEQKTDTTRSTLSIQWPVVTLGIEHDRPLGRASIIGARRVEVAQTMMKWVDGRLTLIVRIVPLPNPHAEISIQYVYNQNMYLVVAQEDIPTLSTSQELCRRMLVNIVSPWSQTTLLSRLGPPPSAEDLLARVRWETIAIANLDLATVLKTCPTLQDVPASSGWRLLGQRNRRAQWLVKDMSVRVALHVSGTLHTGVPLLGFRIGDEEPVSISIDPADLLRGVWMLRIGPRWFSRPVHPFARCGLNDVDLRWVCPPPSAIMGLLCDRAENEDLD